MTLPAMQFLDTARGRVITPIAAVLPAWVTPDILSLIRLLLVPPIAVAVLEEPWGLALVVYLLAALTDALDGEVARLRGQVTAFGARLDPTVDKILHVTLAVLFLPVAPRLLKTMITLDIALFLIGFLILLTNRRAERIAGANVYGKWKFTLQAIGMFLIFLAALSASPTLVLLAKILLGAALIFAALSMNGYLEELHRRTKEKP